MEFSVNGKTAYAHTGGKNFDPNGEVVILVHGAAMSHLAWSLQTRYLAHHGYSVLALDLPGHGRSEGDVADSVEAYAEWLLAAMDTLSISSATLFGHSLGALVSLHVAGTAPDRVKRLGLLGAAYPMAVNDAFLNAADQNLPLATALMNDWSHGRRAHKGGFQVPGLWMIGADTRVVEQASPGVMHQCLKICNDYAGGEAAMAVVQCPTRAILGDNDMMTPLRAGRKISAAIQGAETTILPGAGHMMMFEDPDGTLNAMKALLAS